MKLRLIALATVCTLPLSLFPLFATRADEGNQPCEAYLDTSGEVDNETNNCSTTGENFSIEGTFSNSNWQASFGRWEPGYYILYVKNQQDGHKVNVGDFNVRGMINRPQYQFTDENQGLTYVVTFQYSDPDTIQLEIYQKNQVIVDELLVRESDELLGRP
jgi:hypothetical protein